jgi:hypothetical protein
MGKIFIPLSSSPHLTFQFFLKHSMVHANSLSNGNSWDSKFWASSTTLNFRDSENELDSQTSEEIATAYEPSNVS